MPPPGHALTLRLLEKSGFALTIMLHDYAKILPDICL